MKLLIEVECQVKVNARYYSENGLKSVRLANTLAVVRTHFVDLFGSSHILIAIWLPFADPPLNQPAHILRLDFQFKIWHNNLKTQFIHLHLLHLFHVAFGWYFINWYGCAKIMQNIHIKTRARIHTHKYKDWGWFFFFMGFNIFILWINI